MKRRVFITLIGAAAIAPRVTLARQSVRRVAVLLGASDNPVVRGMVAAFRNELQRRGWVEGQNVTIELRLATADPVKIRTAAAELMRDPPDVFLALSTLEVRALLDQTSTIPIIFTMVVDAVGSGFVQSLSNPGGSITGFENFETSLGSKWVELLRELLPASSGKLGLVLDNPDYTYTSRLVRSAEDAASRLDMQVTRIELQDAAAAKKALENFGAAGLGGLVVLPSQAAASNAEMIIAAANQYKLPAVYPLRSFIVPRGGLISYGVNLNDQFRRGAEYVDRILRGEKPATLPVQAPTRYELVVNLKAAKAQGFTVPPTLLASADEIIE